ncbi:MAG TPA: VWA domain-containing protein [Vicinamibacterales bacterium]|nr:VWA domain-containing protein [Vicinamibacterales bacterium]
MLKNARVRFAAAFVLLAGAAVLAGQTQPQDSTPPQVPTFKAQVEYVEVDAVVTDQQGNFVRNLKKEDFQVFEDGKPQNVSTFTVVDIPIERYERPLFSERPIEPDVKSNERPFDGRVYVLILDDLHVEALRTQRVRQSARQFIERNLGANDLMAIIFTGGRSADAQEFTSNKRLLLNAVDKFTGRKLQSVTLSRNQQYFRQLDGPDAGSRVNDPDDMERGHNAQSMLSTLRQVAEWFGGVHGRRKTMLLFSEGIDYDLNDVIRSYDAPPSSASALLQDIRETIAMTARSNVSIYAVDPRGLATLGDDTIGVSSFADQNDPSAGIGLSSLNNELRLSQDSLRTLSDESGGFAAVNRNDTTAVFDRIVRDNSSYYVLAYYPPTNKADGKFHRIEVKVNRPGLSVRARRGYALPKAKPNQKQTRTGGMTPEMFEAINSPLQVSGLNMRLFAAPFKGPQPNASVVIGIEMSGRDLSLNTNSKVDVSFMAVDNKAKVWGARNDSLTLNLRPESKARVEQTGVRVLNRLELPPGRYQIRAAARDAEKSLIGSIVYDLDVPDFYKQPMSLSGVTLTSLAGAAMLTAQPDEQLKAVLPAPPIALRTFPQNDEIALFAEVYDNSGKVAHKVDIVTSVLTDEGKVVFKTEDQRDSSELNGAKGGYGYSTRVPLTEIPPGLYVLNVEARSRLGTDNVATRQVQFRVVPPVRGPQR